MPFTVEYDIREELSDGTSFYRMEGSSAHVIRELLKRHYNVLSDLDIQKIVRLSDGNARVAFALASTSTEKGQLAQLRDDQLFDRLFHKKNSPNDELMRCAQAASLLYSFFADDEEDGSEVALLPAQSREGGSGQGGQRGLRQSGPTCAYSGCSRKLRKHPYSAAC